jgi:hypothetical protein
MLYIYGFSLLSDQALGQNADRDLCHLLDLLRGISASPTTIVVSVPIVAIVSAGIDLTELRQLPESELLEKILEHDQVICQVFQHCPIVPVRFGTAFPSEALLHSYLQQYKDALVRKLYFLQQKAEYALEFIAKPVPNPNLSKSEPPSDGKSYLLGKKQQYQAQKLWHDRLTNSQNQWMNYLQSYCGQYATPYPILCLPTSDQPHKFYLLLSLSQRLELDNLLQQNSDKWTEWQWQWGEPLPPYHFAELD